MTSHTELQRTLATAAPPANGQAISRSSCCLFHGIGKDDIASFMASGVVRAFARGRIIVRAGDPGTHLYILKTGAADYIRAAPEGQQVLIIRLAPSDTVGLGTILDKPVGYIGTAETLEDTEVYAWEHRQVRQFAAKHPLLAENALRITLEYIRLYSDRHLALVTNNAEDRLAGTLMQLAARTGHHHTKGLEINITNEALAALADVGPFTASRLLQKWERKGAVEKRRGKLVILAPEKMLT